MTSTAPTVAELEQRVLDGDPDITPEQLAAARESDRIAELRAQAAARTAAARDAQIRAEKIAELRADVLTRDPNNGHLVALADAAFDAVAGFLAGLHDHAEQVGAYARRAREVGIPAAEGDTVHDDDHLSWRGDRIAFGLDLPAQITVGRRRINSPRRDEVLAQFLGECANRAEMSRSVDVKRSAGRGTTAAMLSAVDITRPEPQQTTVRLTAKWGRHQPGQTVTTEASTADWLISHRRAVPADHQHDHGGDEQHDDGPAAA